jgi:hypothetical protein
MLAADKHHAEARRAGDGRQARFAKNTARRVRRTGSAAVGAIECFGVHCLISYFPMLPSTVRLRLDKTIFCAKPLRYTNKSRQGDACTKIRFVDLGVFFGSFGSDS